jgi:nicotinamide riboside kinase
MTALRIAIVGAESTGKSALAHALARTLSDELALRCIVVDEYLRTWCDERARTPRADEQMGIALEHARRIEAAAARPGVDVVLCDTTPLMVSVYSDMLFDDRSIDACARACQQAFDATLLTALDLPWVPDGLQRDGPHVRAPVDALVRERLLAWRIDWCTIGGLGEARTRQAFEALMPLLRRRAAHEAGRGPSSPRLAGVPGGPRRPDWRCEHCDLPECERLTRDGAARFR